MNIQQELIDAQGPQPVLVVEVEPDYWHRGHYCEGSKPYINPLEVWKLPVGTKLYTVPPAPSVPNGWKHDCAGILQNDVELWLDSCPHCGKPKTIAAPRPPKLSDERIFDLLKQVDPHAVRLPLGFKQFAIAIEREILGE